jgi:hypothetical protein
MKKSNIFWIGYSDLLTTLFFVMLVLFVVTVGYLRNYQRELEVTIEQQQKILKLDEQFKPLEESGSFHYLPDCQKYIVKDLMGIEIFEPNKSIILKDFVKPTIDAGKVIEKFLEKLHNENPELSYLLVIEGNTANTWDKSYDEDSDKGYRKSYERALAVYELWDENDIDLRQNEDGERYNVEIMLCGSGYNGLCRDDIEENNKRFSIQIIPKVQNRLDK